MLFFNSVTTDDSVLLTSKVEDRGHDIGSRKRRLHKIQNCSKLYNIDDTSLDIQFFFNSIKYFSANRNRRTTDDRKVNMYIQQGKLSS